MSLPQYMTDKVCNKRNHVEMYKLKMFYKFSKPNETVHFPRLDQPESAVMAKIAFDKEAYLGTANKVIQGLVAKVSSGLGSLFKGSQLRSYEQYQLIYNKIASKLMVWSSTIL